MGEFPSPLEGEQQELQPDEDVDDSLPLIERVLNSMVSPLATNRAGGVRSAPDAAREAGAEDTLQRLVPALVESARDPEAVVRQALCEQMPELSALLIKMDYEETYAAVTRMALPVLAALSTDRNPQVRQTASDSIAAISSLLPSEDIEANVLPIVTSLAGDEAEEEYRAEAAQILNSVSMSLRPEVLTDYALPLLNRLSEDTVFRVRKAVASSIAGFCEAIGNDSTTRNILPMFVRLSKDNIWGVRKACSESLVGVAKFVGDQERVDQLIPVFLRLIEDSSRWVRCSAYQNAGPFLSLLRSSEIDAAMLHYFTDMALESTSSRLGDSDIRYCCAFSFPAVLLAIGRDRWSEVRETYFTLVGDLQWKVRRSLAFSLHEVAKVLGTELTEATLLPAFEALLRDLDEVRVGVVASAAEFLSVLTPDTRDRFLSIVADLRIDPSWRIRKLLAKQLGMLTELFESPGGKSSIQAMAFQLLTDSVASAGAVAKHLVGQSLASFVESLLSLAENQQYVSRQLFLNACCSLADHLEPAQFTESFLAPALKLQDDPVPNVRVFLSRLIMDHLLNKEAHAANPDVVAALEKLRADRDRDVAHFAHPPEDSDSAAATCDLPSLRSLLSGTAGACAAATARDANGLSALHLASMCAAAPASDAAEAVRVLLRAVAVDAASPPSQWTALHAAASAGSAAAAAELVAAGAAVDARDASGRTPLAISACNGHDAVVRLLLSAGADPSLCGGSGGESALFLAARAGREAAVKALLEDHRARATLEGENVLGATPLHAACCVPSEPIARMLLQAGSDVNALRRDYYTPLHLAAAKGAPGLVKMLAEAGADLELRTSFGTTALHEAARTDSGETVRVLVAAGASLEARDNDSLTPLHIACQSKSESDGTDAVLGSLGTAFRTPCGSVAALASSEMEGEDCNRDWRWRTEEQYHFSPLRASQQPGYVGSYAMDAMAMALNVVWRSTSFKEVVLAVTNIRGDSDSVASVAGQIAGAFYGASGVPRHWVHALYRWDGNGEIATRAVRLFNKSLL
eukprot:m51a1_g6705 hypothetical protein (1034) ;mRNA; r:103973-110149